MEDQEGEAFQPLRKVVDPVPVVELGLRGETRLPSCPGHEASAAVPEICEWPSWRGGRRVIGRSVFLVTPVPGTRRRLTPRRLGGAHDNWVSPTEVSRSHTQGPFLRVRSHFPVHGSWGSS